MSINEKYLIKGSKRTHTMSQATFNFVSMTFCIMLDRKESCKTNLVP